MKTGKGADRVKHSRYRLSRREMLKLSASAVAGTAILPAAGCNGGGPAATSDTACLNHIPRRDVDTASWP